MSILQWDQLCADEDALARGPRRKDYTHVRCYHLCRPESQDSYQKFGILMPTQERLYKSFDRIFHDFSEADREAAKTERRRKSSDDEDRIDVTLDFRAVEFGLNHYSAFGSERLQDLAVRLPGQPKERLRTIGIPTLLVVDIPIDQLRDSEIESLDETFRDLHEMHHIRSEPNVCTLSLWEPAPAEWIVEIRTLTDLSR